MLVSERIQKEAKGGMLRKVLQANKVKTTRAEFLALAIEHYCTTERPMDEKLKVLLEAESYMEHVKQSVALSRQTIADYKAEATTF